MVISCPSVRFFYFEKTELRAKTLVFWTACIQTTLHCSAVRKVKMRDSQLAPYLRGSVSTSPMRAFHEEIVFFAPDPENELIGKIRKILRRPVRITLIGNYDSQPTGTIGLELNRCFQPALRREPYHEAGLIVLVNRKKLHLGAQNDIAFLPHEEEVTVVRFKAIMSLLPEIGFCVRHDCKTRIGYRPCRRRTAPAQASVKVRALERLE